MRHFYEELKKLSDVDDMRLRPRSTVKPVSAVPPNSKFKVKQGFATSQYSGPLGYGGFPQASMIPPWWEPPVKGQKTAGPPPPKEEESSRLESSGDKPMPDGRAGSLKTASGYYPYLLKKYKANEGTAFEKHIPEGLAAIMGPVSYMIARDEGAGRLGAALFGAAAAGGNYLAGMGVQSALVQARAPLNKTAGTATTPAGLFAKARSVGAPKIRAPGPSIAQQSKPVGFGRALPGLTKRAELEKAALIERLVRLAATPIKGTPNLIMKNRSPAELRALQNAVEAGWSRRVTDPIMRTITPAVEKVPEGRVRELVRKGARLVAEDPIGTVAANLVPVPGAHPGYVAGKKVLERAIDRVAPV